MTRRRRRRLVAAALPRHGAHRLRARAPRLPHADRLPPAAALPEAPGALARRRCTRHKGTISFGPNFAYALCVKRIRERELERHRSLELARRRLRRRADPPRDPRGLRRELRAGRLHRRTRSSPRYGMAESTLAISFTELGEGMKTLSVDGETLWGENRAKVVPEDDERAVRLVSCGTTFEGHDIAVFAPDDAESATPLARGPGRRAPHQGPERDEGLLAGRRAHARGLRRRLAARRATSAPRTTATCSSAAARRRSSSSTAATTTRRTSSGRRATSTACARATSSPSAHVTTPSAIASASCSPSRCRTRTSSSTRRSSCSTRRRSCRLSARPCSTA